MKSYTGAVATLLENLINVMQLVQTGTDFFSAIAGPDEFEINFWYSENSNSCLVEFVKIKDGNVLAVEIERLNETPPNCGFVQA